MAIRSLPVNPSPSSASESSESKENRLAVQQYADQPAQLPKAIRLAVEERSGEASVQLFALADLDADYQFARTWVVLTEDVLHLLRGEQEPSIQSIPIKRITKIEEQPLLSGTVLRFLAERDEAPLAVLRHTHRQRGPLAAIRFLVADRIEGGDAVPTEDPEEVYNEAIAAPIRKAQASVTATGRTVILRLADYLKPYSAQVIIGLVAAFGVAILAIIPGLATGALIDRVVFPFQRGAIDYDAAYPLAVKLILAITAAYLFRLVLLWVRLHVMAYMGEYVARDLRRTVYDKVQKLSLSYFDSNQTGSVISRVTSDTDRIWEFIAFGVVEVSLSIVTILALSAVLIWKDWQLGLVMVLPVPLIIWAILWNGRQMQRLYIRAWRKWSDLTAVVADTVPGMRIVKAFHQEDHEKRRFGSRNDSMSDSFIDVHRNWTKFWPLLLLSIQLISIAVYWLALPRLLSDSSAPDLTGGTLVTFVMLMAMFFQPIEIFGQMARMLNRSVSSARRVFELIDMEPDVREVADPVRPETLKGAIEFEDVSFAYDGVRLVLRDLNFTLKPGEMVGIVGSSGAGKTTLLNLVPRFHDVTSGTIRIDDQDLATLDLGWLRERVGLVPQDPFLFHGTILENIRYGLPGASLVEVVEAARSASAHDFISKLPLGYDTVVGERGHTMSGGERQRVAIARAILHDPVILLLDEATSSVDSETESQIQKALDHLVKGRTTLVIAHRLSTLAKADRILVIEKGRLAEEGRPADLLRKKDGLYRKMHGLQIKASKS